MRALPAALAAILAAAAAAHAAPAKTRAAADRGDAEWTPASRAEQLNELMRDLDRDYRKRRTGAESSRNSGAGAPPAAGAGAIVEGTLVDAVGDRKAAPAKRAPKKRPSRPAK